MRAVLLVITAIATFVAGLGIVKHIGSRKESGEYSYPYWAY